MHGAILCTLTLESASEMFGDANALMYFVLVFLDPVVAGFIKNVPSELINLFAGARQGPRDTAFTIDPDVLLEAFKTNSVAPALVSEVALPFLEKGSMKKILYISSTCGSLGSADEMGVVMAGYSMTKSALNMLAYKQKLERPDLTVITLCPGSVKTDMSGEYGIIEPHESVAGLLKVIISASAADSGKYLRYNGETIPW
ncbi:C-factor [Trametes pubescens]|uniref:C-factor n=1 Tax=Trametes pubescens TaxID=154538 RepID=A0A1M2VUX4_TRAPU|nr:C-factor [Trametes pubescens]